MSIENKIKKLLESMRRDQLMTMLKRSGKISNLRTTEEDETGHIHIADLDSNGNGETSIEGNINPHSHKVIKYVIQPAMCRIMHIHKFK